MGSNATYQCRDGSSDVYTTQCTSDGVWEPNPNSTHCTDTSDGVWELDPNSTQDYEPPGIVIFYAIYTILNQLVLKLYTHCCKAKWGDDLVSLSLFLCSYYNQRNFHCTTHWSDSGNADHSDCSW